MSESNNFKDLKRLLKLKQHEVPPPGYFNHFSGDIIARIRAGESGEAEGVMARLQSGAPWLAGLLRIFEARPGVIGGFATSLCLLLLIGVVMVDHQDGPSAVGGGMSAQASPDAGPALASTVALAPAGENTGISIGTNGVSSLQPVATLFGSQANPLFQSASFMPQQ